MRGQENTYVKLGTKTINLN